MSSANRRGRRAGWRTGWWLGWAGLWWLTGTSAPAAEPLEKCEYLQIRMGVSVAIQVYAADREAANQAADAAYARFRQLDRILSDYDPDSELMRLCATSGTGKVVPVSDDLARVLQRSQTLAEQTGGAFDVTVGPIVNLWRVARRRNQPPDADRLREALSRVGFRKLQLDPHKRTVELRQPGMRLDLGGIAVGYAVDEAMKVFRERGLTRVLIDASGDIAVGDPPPGRDHWHVSIEPLGNQQEPRLTLALRNCAVTTSGDASRFVEFDGVRYSHIVDPQTGLGLTQRTSATVVAPDCATADSLATTVNVLGPEQGLKLIAETPGTEAAIEYIDDEEQLRSMQSRGFGALLANSSTD